MIGSAGSVVVSNTAPQYTSLWDSSGRWENPTHYYFLERYKEAYVAEMREFVQCVLEDKEPSVGGQDGLWAARLGLAAKRSVAEKRPVRLEEEKSEQYVG